MTTCLDEQVSVKKARTKQCSNNKKQSFNEKDADSSCMEMTTNSSSNPSHLFKSFIFLNFQLNNLRSHHYNRFPLI
jgi:hypothetical protein